MIEVIIRPMGAKLHNPTIPFSYELLVRRTDDNDRFFVTGRWRKVEEAAAYAAELLEIYETTPQKDQPGWLKRLFEE